MNNFIYKLTDFYRKGTEGIKIIYICTIASLVYWLLNFILIKTLSFSLDSVLLLSAHSFIPFVWTLFTFLFINTNLMDLAFGMIMIYFTERIFRLYFNGESFVKFFFLGSLLGGILFLLFSFITGQTSVFLNGSILGVYSVMFAIISYNPKMEVSLFPLPLKFPIYVLGLFLIGLDIFSLYSQHQPLSLFIARLGAATFGYLYMKFFQTGNDFLGRLIPDFNNFNKIFSFFKLKSRSHLKVKKGNYQHSSHPITDEEFSIKKIDKQKKTDAILDKISKNGYENLTKEEKDFLFNAPK